MGIIFKYLLGARHRDEFWEISGRVVNMDCVSAKYMDWRLSDTQFILVFTKITEAKNPYYRICLVLANSEFKKCFQ